jgi:hypothetical protein
VVRLASHPHPATNSVDVEPQHTAPMMGASNTRVKRERSGDSNSVQRIARIAAFLVGKILEEPAFSGEPEAR